MRSAPASEMSLVKMSTENGTEQSVIKKVEKKVEGQECCVCPTSLTLIHAWIVCVRIQKNINWVPENV